MDTEKLGRGCHTISSDYLISLSEQAFERGVNVGDLLAGSGLSPKVLLLQDVSIGHESFLQAVSNFQAVDGNLWSALEGGRRMTLSKHGYLGYAAQHSRSVPEAADKLYRYVSTRVDFITLQRGEHSDRAEVIIQPQVSDSPAMRYVCLSLMVCLETLSRQILGRPATQLASRITMTGPAPDSPAPQLPGGSSILFDHDYYSVSWPRSVLDTPLSSRNDDLASLAVARCESELRRSQPSQNTTSRVVAQLQRSRGESPAIDDIAARLNMSTATLQRRLKSEHCSFQQLKDQIRERQARELLRSPASVEQIAEQLGYSDASNFTKAFKSWTGCTPSQFRQQETN